MSGSSIPTPKASPGKWLVHHGIHSGTIGSRDTNAQEYDSEAEARAVFARCKAGYAERGVFVWFAHMYDDQGNMTVLDKPTPVY